MESPSDFEIPSDFESPPDFAGMSGTLILQVNHILQNLMDT